MHIIYAKYMHIKDMQSNITKIKSLFKSSSGKIKKRWMIVAFIKLCWQHFSKDEMPSDRVGRL